MNKAEITRGLQSLLLERSGTHREAGRLLDSADTESLAISGVQAQHLVGGERLAVTVVWNIPHDRMDDAA